MQVPTFHHVTANVKAFITLLGGERELKSPFVKLGYELSGALCRV